MRLKRLLRKRYLRPQDFPDGSFELEGVVVVHCHHVRPADVLVCVRVLRGDLRRDPEALLKVLT